MKRLALGFVTTFIFSALLSFSAMLALVLLTSSDAKAADAPENHTQWCTDKVNADLDTVGLAELVDSAPTLELLVPACIEQAEKADALTDVVAELLRNESASDFLIKLYREANTKAQYAATAYGILLGRFLQTQWYEETFDFSDAEDTEDSGLGCITDSECEGLDPDVRYFSS